MTSPEAIGPWLKEPSPAFDGSTPLPVVERGETDRKGVKKVSKKGSVNENVMFRGWAVAPVYISID
jgi:hypothetical protein